MPGEEINVREYRRRKEKWDNPEKKARGKTKHNTICVGHHFTEANTNNTNKT